MDSMLYMRILQDGFVPFVADKYPNGNCLLVEDNDPKHRSKYSQAKKEILGITTMDWPAESPDLMPIEKLWHQMKHFLRKNVKPKNLDELRAGIIKFWGEKVTKENILVIYNT
jgi:hypothetical protein